MRTRLLAGLWALGFGLWTAHSADLTTGYSFSANEQNVTHTKLNNAVNNATISTGFFTDKAAATSLSSSDVLLLYSASLGEFRKMTADNFLYGNTALITGRSEDTAPVGTDYLLSYDSSDTALKKVLASTLWSKNWSLSTFTNLAAHTAPATADALLVYDSTSGTNRQLTLGALQLAYSFTNLAAHTAPTNADALLLWSSDAGTNRQITLASLLTNAPTPAAFTNTDKFLILSMATNGFAGATGVVAQATLADIEEFVTNGIAQPDRQTISGIAVPTTKVVTTNAHTLGAVPEFVRVVLRCETADLGYAAGDEVAVESALATGAGYAAVVTVTVDGANVYLSHAYGDSNVQLPNRNTPSGGYQAITKANWRLKVYLEDWP